jgi:hypothetical protein
MKIMFANLSLLLGAACFFLGSIALFLGRLGGLRVFVLPALGLILVGVGAAVQRLSTKEQ